MTTKNSDIEDAIKTYWREYAKNDTDKRPGHDPITIIKLSEHHAQRHNIDFLKDYVFVLDEHISWFIAMSSVLFNNLDLVSDEGADNSSNRLRLLLYWLVINTIVLHLFSIRLLVISGFDIPAKQVLRVLREWVDFLFVLHTKEDEDVAEKFVKSISHETSNEFWHKYISKYRARKNAEDHAAAFLETYSYIISEDISDGFNIFNMIDEWKDWKKSRDSSLSTAIHPSIRTAYLSSMLSTESIDGVWFPAWGFVTAHSLMTIDYTLVTLTEVMVILYDIPFRSKKLPNIEFDENNETHRQISIGRHRLPEFVRQLNELVKPLIEQEIENNN